MLGLTLIASCAESELRYPRAVHWLPSRVWTALELMDCLHLLEHLDHISLLEQIPLLQTHHAVQRRWSNSPYMSTQAQRQQAIARNNT
jgi:hypothetical protein